MGTHPPFPASATRTAWCAAVRGKTGAGKGGGCSLPLTRRLALGFSAAPSASRLDKCDSSGRRSSVSIRAALFAPAPPRRPPFHPACLRARYRTRRRRLVRTPHRRPRTVVRARCRKIVLAERNAVVRARCRKSAPSDRNAVVRARCQKTARRQTAMPSSSENGDLVVDEDDGDEERDHRRHRVAALLTLWGVRNARARALRRYTARPVGPRRRNERWAQA